MYNCNNVCIGLTDLYQWSASLSKCHETTSSISSYSSLPGSNTKLSPSQGPPELNLTVSKVYQICTSPWVKKGTV